jgi:hypothetical protein
MCCFKSLFEHGPRGFECLFPGPPAGYADGHLFRFFFCPRMDNYTHTYTQEQRKEQYNKSQFSHDGYLLFSGYDHLLYIVLKKCIGDFTITVENNFSAVSHKQSKIILIFYHNHNDLSMILDKISCPG